MRYAHGVTVLYLISEVELEVVGTQFRLKAVATLENLPVSALLGTDITQQSSFFNKEKSD